MIENNLIVISKYKNKYLNMHIVNDKVRNMYVYDKLVEDIMIGTIVNGRIEKKLDNINACFVRTGSSEKGYINKAIKCETVLPVMYKKEPVGEKKAQYTDELSITGQYVIVFSGNDFIRCSSKISAHKSKELKKEFAAIFNKYRFGMLIRTDAVNDVSGAKQEAEAICERLKDVIDSSTHIPDGKILYRPLPQIVDDCLNFSSRGANEIVTDCEDVIEVLNENYDAYLGRKPLYDIIGIRKYSDKLLPLSNLYSFEAKVSNALSRKIHMRNGAFFTIERTEALYAIDVNSGSYTSNKSDKEANMLQINIEVFHEIVRHIILRNISGVIYIDFLKMKSEDSYDTLSDIIEQAIRNDVVKFDFYGFTGLGLAEFARQKKRVSLDEAMR